MSQHRVRIRRVKFKSGGELRLLNDQTRENHDDVAAWARRDMDRLIDEEAGKLAGYAVVMWGADSRIGAAVRVSHYSPYIGDALPGLAGDAVRRVLSKVQINRALGLDDNG